MKKLILFDFDGVVINSTEGIYNCIGHSLTKLGIPVPDTQTLAKFVGPSLFDGFCTYIENDGAKAECFVKYYRERYAPVGYKECSLYSGIEKTFEQLTDRGFTLAICSNKPGVFVEKITRHLGIRHFFSELFCPELTDHSTNKAQLILNALDFFKLNPEDALMVGDTCLDIRAAKKAGVASMAVFYGFSRPGELEKEKPDYCAQSPEQIFTLISKPRRCVIFGAGEYGNHNPEILPDDMVITADGGYSHCLEYGITPELFIGDFDSEKEETVNFGGRVIRLPAEKDLTDSEAAIKEGLKENCGSFVFYGCLGGRLDHTLGNIALLKDLAQRGICAVMHGKDCLVTAVSCGTVSLPSRQSGTVSVFALSDKASGVNIKGLKYPLEDYVLTNTVTVGVSNEFTAQPAYIGVKEGVLLIVQQNS